MYSWVANKNTRFPIANDWIPIPDSSKACLEDFFAPPQPRFFSDRPSSGVSRSARSTAPRLKMRDPKNPDR